MTPDYKAALEDIEAIKALPKRDSHYLWHLERLENTIRLALTEAVRKQEPKAIGPVCYNCGNEHGYKSTHKPISGQCVICTKVRCFNDRVSTASPTASSGGE